METKFFFSSIKEGRSSYFVEYRPPGGGTLFATLQLVFVDATPKADVALAMEAEASIWFIRFPVPLMVSAFGPDGDLVHLDTVRNANHLMISGPGAGIQWELLKNDELSQVASDRERLLQIYAGVPYRTSDEVQLEQRRHHRRTRAGWWIVFLWAAVAPTAFLIIEFLGPEWLATAVFLYGLYKASERILKMLGFWKKSNKERAKEEEDRRMRHHHYHCDLNPNGFLRLKLENLENDHRQAIAAESRTLDMGTK